MQTPFSPLSFGKNFMKIENPFSRSRERLYGIFVADGKKQKTTKKQKKQKNL